MDWSSVDLVAFDLDGTLYDQRPMRRRMAAEIALQVVTTASLRVPHIIATYRAIREAAAVRPGAAVQPYAATADRCGVSEGDVRRAVDEWIERRPLRHIRQCRRSGIDRLFDGLRASRRVIAVLSDYPTDAKLAAMDLRADVTVSAIDRDVMRLKPDPAGLAKILRVTGMSSARTLVIGDRDDRDGEVARRVGVRSLILTKRGHALAGGFRSYADPIFMPILAQASPPIARAGQAPGMARAAGL